MNVHILPKDDCQDEAFVMSIENRVAMVMHSIGSGVEYLKVLSQEPGGMEAIKSCSNFYGAELALSLIRNQERQS